MAACFLLVALGKLDEAGAGLNKKPRRVKGYTGQGEPLIKNQPTEVILKLGEDSNLAVVETDKITGINGSNNK